MTRIALVLSGGASLGSYIGGAVTEILRALETNRADGSLTVDVITGASAGALNAGMAARALAVNPSLRPWIERVWVEAADAGVLFNPDRRDRRGLLDGAALDELTRAVITTDPASDDRPSDSAGRRLRVGVTLSNLDGLPYRFHHGFLNAPGRFFGTRIYRDWLEVELEGKPGRDGRQWERLRRAAVASASFPAAFPPRGLERSADEYPGAELEPGPDGELEMWYADGGLFDNEPVGLAKRLVEQWPNHHAQDWRYILVDPHMEDQGAASSGPAGRPEGLGDVARRVAGAVLGQGAARDWVRTHKTNARLEILEALAGRLPEIHGRLDDPDAVGLGRHIGELAESVAEMKVRVRRTTGDSAGDPVVDYLEENLGRIESDPRYAPALEEVQSRAGRSRIKKLIFVLEAAAGLRDKEFMPLYLVAPPQGERLAGEFLGNFGGFFDSRWRQADFRAGRRDARRVLTGDLSDLFDYEAADPREYEPEELEPTFDELSGAARRKLRDAVGSEVQAALDRMDTGRIASLLSWAWQPPVRRWVTDRVMERMRGTG